MSVLLLVSFLFRKERGREGGDGWVVADALTVFKKAHNKGQFGMSAALYNLATAEAMHAPSKKQTRHSRPWAGRTARTSKGKERREDRTPP